MAARSLKLVIAEVLESDPGELDETSGMNETENWDSLHQFLIMAAIESAFEVKLPFSAIESVRNVGEIRSVLLALGADPAD